MIRRILLSLIVTLSVGACEDENTSRLREDLSLNIINETKESFEGAKLYTGRDSIDKGFAKSDSIILDIAPSDNTSTTWNPKINKGDDGFLLKITDQRQELFGYYTNGTLNGFKNFKITIKADTIEITQSK